MDQFASSDLLDLPLDHWQRRALDFLGPFFAGTRHLVRISTGFFSIQGYNLLRPYLAGKRVHIMVGYDERSRQDLHKALLDEIMDDLSRWHEARRSAVAMLVAALRAGDVRIIEARTRLNDHAKVFLFDEQVAISGSTNVTRNGLLSNFEGNLGISTRTDPVRVTWWQATFTQLWNHPDTTDITNELLERLEAWLRLRNPWDIYLKTMQALVPEDKPTPPRTSYKTPTEFQLVVIQRALRQLTTLRGAMIVASTGLGKTIMGTHIAYELRHSHQRILNVLVFAPKHLKDEWRRRLRSAGLSADAIFTINLLDQPDLAKGSDGDVKRMLEVLAELDEQWLIIIDESQYFRHNIRANGDPRLAHERLQDAVARSKCLVLLLTATPFATNVEDLQGQLCILPHTAPQVQPQLPCLADTTEAAWTVTQVADLMAIPVSTVINTPYVAQYYAVDDGDGKGDYVLFGDERRYIPRIHIRQIRYPPLEDSALKKARKTGVFQHQPLRYRRRKKWGVSKDQIEQHIALAAESSPAALLDVLNQVIASTSDGGYRVMYHRPRSIRMIHLRTLIQRLERMRLEDDQKLMRLYATLRVFLDAGRKVLIFVERLSTAVYLERGLTRLGGWTRVACTVRDEGTDTGDKPRYVQKDFKQEVAAYLAGFAPCANPHPDGTQPDDLYDILITSDAYGEGANLQDASVVINYDLAWTPDRLIQRVGRILRFWTEPRVVDLIFFTREAANDGERTHREEHQERRIRQLTSRARDAEQFTEIPILPEDERRIDTLRGLSTIKIENIGVLEPRALEDRRFEVSTFLSHLTALRKHHKEVRQLPDDICSALVSTAYHHPRIFTLIQRGRSYEWLLYDIDRRRAERIAEDILLDRIRCDPDTVPAEVDPQWIEQCRQEAIAFWCQQKPLRPDEQAEIRHICSLYLAPGQEAHRLLPSTSEPANPSLAVE